MHEADQSDGQLLAEFATTGSHGAFAQIVERHGAMVHAVAKRVVEDHHAAEDVAQAAFLALARKATSLRRDSSVGAWLHHVAWCLAQDAGKIRRRRESNEVAAMRECEPSAPAEVDRQAFQAELDAAINQLAERYRRPLVLFHLEGQSLQQTAECLGLNLNTVRTQLTRARELLRQKLVRRGVTVSSVGVLMTLLSAETGAATLPATFVSATVKAASLAATGKLAAGVATGAVSANVATMTKGVINMLFWNSVKTAAVITAATLVVAGGGALVAQEVVAPRKAAEPQAAPPATAVSATAAQPAVDVVRFIRLKHNGAGWDDGMDEKAGADRNFLEQLGQLAGLKVSTNGEVHGIGLLVKYPKDFAPRFAYITGTDEMTISDEEVKALQAYLAAGGLLWADCGGPKWDASFRALMTRVFPDAPLRDIPDNDPLFSAPFKFPNGAPPLWQHGGRRALGIKLQDRWAVFYHPGDMNDAWKTGHSGLSDAAAKSAFELGVNVVSYARNTATQTPRNYTAAQNFWKVFVTADMAALGEQYADEVVLKAGSEFLKKEWGISDDKTKDKKVARVDLIKAYSAMLAKIGKEKWQAVFGGITEDKITVKTLENKHVVLIVRTGPGDDQIEFELAPNNDRTKWRVVSEYTDY